MKNFKSFLRLYLNMRAISYVCSCVCRRGTCTYESVHVHVCAGQRSTLSDISDAFHLVF